MYAKHALNNSWYFLFFCCTNLLLTCQDQRTRALLGTVLLKHLCKT